MKKKRKTRTKSAPRKTAIRKAAAPNKSKKTSKKKVTPLKVVVATIEDLARLNEDGEFKPIKLKDYIAGDRDCIPKRIVEARTRDNVPVRFGTVTDIPVRPASGWKGERREKGVKPFCVRPEFFIGQFIPKIGRLQFNRRFPWVHEVFAPTFPPKCEPDMQLLYNLFNGVAQDLSTVMASFSLPKGIPQPPSEEFEDPTLACYLDDSLDYPLNSVLKRMIQDEVIKCIVRRIMKHRRAAAEERELMIEVSEDSNLSAVNAAPAP